MKTHLRTGLLMLLVSMLLVACGGGSSGSSHGNGTTTPSRDTTPDPVPNTEPVAPPVAADLTTNVFFPVSSDLALYYDNDLDPVVLGETLVEGDVKVYPLIHPDERVEYITSTTNEVGLKGVYARLIEGTSPVYLDLQFNEPRKILGNTTPYRTSGNAMLSLSGIPGTYPVPVTLTATRTANESIAVAGFPAQPARKIHLEMKLTVDFVTRGLILLAYPWAEPFLNSLALDLWFVPGVGIAKVQQGEWKTVINRVEGIPQPHVFSFLRNASVNGIAAQQILIDGEAVTDMQWKATTYYRTTGIDWLNVSFDATGSWRARITRTNLDKGVYAATVRFAQGNVTKDVTVSVLVR